VPETEIAASTTEVTGRAIPAPSRDAGSEVRVVRTAVIWQRSMTILLVVVRESDDLVF
jgi:hypothetical protein